MSFIGTYEYVKKRKYEEIYLFFSKKRFHGKIGRWERFRAISTLCLCTVWINEKFTLILKRFRQIIYLVISLVKPLFSRNFFQKSMRVNFRNFHTVLCFVNTIENSWKYSLLYLFFSFEVGFCGRIH